MTEIISLDGRLKLEPVQKNDVSFIHQFQQHASTALIIRRQIPAAKKETVIFVDQRIEGNELSNWF